MPSFDHERVVIRQAKPADHACIRALFEESRLEGQLRCNDTGADIDDLEAGYFGDEGASGFWVACVDDTVIGMVGVQRTREKPSRRPHFRYSSNSRCTCSGNCLPWAASWASKAR